MKTWLQSAILKYGFTNWVKQKCLKILQIQHETVNGLKLWTASSCERPKTVKGLKLWKASNLLCNCMFTFLYFQIAPLSHACNITLSHTLATQHQSVRTATLSGHTNSTLFTCHINSRHSTVCTSECLAHIQRTHLAATSENLKMSKFCQWNSLNYFS
jgi:hypothetical protein